LERELILLARKSVEQPALLTPSDLDPLRKIIGDRALDYAHVIVSFHYINRIADMLNVPHEALSLHLRRFEWLRRATVHAASYFMSKMDLTNREFESSYERAVENITPIFKRVTGREPQDEFKPFIPRPKLVEVMQMLLEERYMRGSLDHATITRVQRTVENALPTNAHQAGGIHSRLEDPVDDFAFVGTRYAYRTTPEMIVALRRCGYDDTGILDLAIVVADANDWARAYRLYGLDPNLLYFEGAS
jgi:hypothetical protein